MLYVIIESVNGENHNDKKEWFFIDERNQNLIFEEIATTFFLETESILTSRKIKQITYKSVENTKQIPLTTIFSQQNLAQATFCIAFANASRLSKNNTVNIKSNFEILLFSCVVCFQKLNNSKRNYEWSEYLSFLINYLENINLSHQIKELDLYFNNRFEFFSEQLDLIKSETNPDFDALHHNFFIKPLQNKKKYKVSENWSTAHFANAVLLLIVDIETKIDVLISISV